ncbi:MAG: GAF domain-containing protein [Sedimentisphaerales bacterium]|nr:GAF domain-containing protein [Sedimentisphaerales bacterium]
MEEMSHHPEISSHKPVTRAWMRDLSLRHKLVAIIMLTCVSALFLAGAVFTAWEWTSLRKGMVRDLSTYADILADNCKAAITFEVATDANEVLRTVAAVPSILLTGVYKKDRTLFAAYRRPDADVTVPLPEHLPRGHLFKHGRLTLAQPITLEGETIGTICLISDLEPMYTRLAHGIGVIVSILIVASLAAYLVSAKVQGVISSPILYLAGVANFVSQKKQYAIRAEQHSTDEVGLLIEAFNEMLEQIQQRDTALVGANEQLEARVRERTAELTRTNEKLTREIVFRKKAEQILKQRTERIIHHQRTLVKLSKYTHKDLASAIRKTTEEAARTLSVERVGVWFLNDGSDELVCEDLYQQSRDSHEEGQRLEAADCPGYFQAIDSNRIVAVDDARRDPRTRELTKEYLEPAGITSLLDVPIRLHGKTLGVLSHEHVNAAREWSLEEQDFAASIADMISLQIEANERQKAERALAKANEHLADIVRELRRSNKELQDFAYVTAHDLKAPLRGIGTLTDWITSDYADKLDEQGRQQLQLLKGRVSRMSELIDSILHYSEIGRTAKRVESVDLNGLLPEIVGQLSPPENIQITIDPDLPTLVAEKARLIQLFQNLIGNAIKYMDKPAGRIDVSCVSQDDHWKFGIADNGPGIDRKYFTKIFQMFQTLTRRDELESTGIGLAVVKKIVDLYGGNVWVESTVGEGTTFYFTLPKQPVAAQEAVLVTDEACLN